MRLSAGEIAEAAGGALVVEAADAAPLTGVTWDSRDVVARDLYVALAGERVDGHAFVAAALDAGAGAALVTRAPDEAMQAAAREHGAALIQVGDAQAALGAVAGAWRRRLRGRVVALSGSTGKTTTKNLVRDVLSAAGTVVATAGNQNSELGVPKTILSADEDTDAVVVEMGMRGAGQLAALCAFVRPDFGLLTNIGVSHIELLGSRENIARAKAELLAALPDGRGCAFLNAADDMTDFARAEARLDGRGVQTVLYDGSPEAAARRAAAPEDERAAVWAESVVLDGMGRPHFTLRVGGAAVPCALDLQGLHNVANACAAAAVAHACGMEAAAIACALEAARPAAGRQEVVQAPGGFTVVNDAYNANPDSMRASLLTFAALDVPGSRIAVLGDMGELGEGAPQMHADVGALAATLPLDLLVCVGELAQGIADAAERGGMDAARIVRAAAVDEALAAAQDKAAPGDAVLVKASRFMELERVVEGLVS